MMKYRTQLIIIITVVVILTAIAVYLIAHGV